MPQVIAIVGRPNVGKSALFNRIAGRRIAIVHNEPGVTRDRITAEIEWRGRPLTLADTGGIGLLRGEKTDDAIARAAYDQVQIAVDSAEVIIQVTNVQEGLTPLDREVAARLRRTGKPVLVAINKADNDAADAGADEFSELGFDALFPISALHGRGIEDLMKAALAALPDATPETPEDARNAADSTPLKIAVVGRPNVGKSSIINALTRSQRVIVSPVPGTTRDAVDVPFEVETDGRRESFLLIDTAGIRKKRRVDTSVEFFSVTRAEDSIARSDLVVFIIDAESSITEQDKKIGDIIVEKKKACVVVINKWDLVEEQVREQRKQEAERKTQGQRGPRRLLTLADFGKWVQERLFFLDYAPVVFTSAVSGFHLEQLLEAVRYVAAQLQQKIPTAILNRALHEAVETRQPSSRLGHRLKFYYSTQIRQAPPTFLLFVNRTDLFSPAYEKYLADGLRQAFGFEGCPVIVIPRSRPKTVESIRLRSGTRQREAHKRR